MTDEKQQQQMQKYMELQQIDQQMKQIQKQLMLLDEQIQELHITKQALDDIKNTEPGTGILAPVSSGIFISSELKDNKEVRINVGSGTVVKKSIPEAKELIQKQLDEIKKIHKDMLANMQNLGEQAEMLQKELM